MNKISTRTLALAAVFALALGSAGFAVAKGHMMGGMHALSPEQQEIVQKMHADFYKATDALRQQIIVKEAEIKAQVYSATPDTAKIEALSKELGALEGKLLVERVGLKAKLTKEGIPTAGHGMMEGKGDKAGMGGMMGGEKGKGCPMMQGMDHGADAPAAPSDHAPKQNAPAAPATPNKGQHRM